MRIFNIDAWPTTDETRTDPPGTSRCFVGVAIGPDSDDGLVAIDGVTLQAGRVLPMRSLDGYGVKRLSGVAPPNADGLSGTLASVRRCQLMLFESEAEMACEVARPNGRYSTAAATPTGVPLGGDAITVRVLTFPAVGRRQAIVSAAVSGSTDAHPYRIIGRKYYRSLKQVVETVLVDTVMTLGVIHDVIGGMDVAESYDEYALDVDGTAGSPTNAVFADAETLGELGVS